MKMYILIKESVPTGFAVLASAHAALAAYLRWQDRPEVQAWISGPFRKVICKVSDAEFESAKRHADHLVMTESALDDQEVAIAFLPREQWPKAFQFYCLYK